MSLHATLVRLWRWIRPAFPGPALVGRAHRRAAERARTLVHAVYALNFVVMIRLLKGWPRWAGEPSLDPLWPVFWAKAVGSAHAAAIVGATHFVTSTLALLWPESRPARVLCVLTALPAFALQSSFGKVNHGLHGLLWVLLIFVCLPSRSPGTDSSGHLRRRFDQRTLRVFWAAQAALLLFYSMSGALKLYASVGQLARGQASFLSPDGAARHVAHRLLQTNGQSLLGPFLIERPWAGAPIQWLTVYLELLSLLVAFRPACHRLWAIGLLAMHAGIGLFMNIWFVNHMAVVALVLACSPFVREGASFSGGLRALPGVGLVLKRLG